MTEKEGQDIKFAEAQARVVNLFTESAEGEAVFKARETAFAQKASKAWSISELFAIMAEADWDLASTVKLVLDI